MELTDYQKDIFREIGNVGMGTGATALSQMINRQVNITFPHVNLIKIDNIFSMKGDYLISSCQLDGDLDGHITAIFDKKNGLNLIDLMFFREIGSSNNVDEEGKGAYNEMLNVIGGCYLNSLADMLKIRIMPKPPIFLLGDLVSVKDSMLKQFENVKNSFFVQTDFEIDGVRIVGNIYLILTEDSNKKVLQIIDSLDK